MPLAATTSRNPDCYDTFDHVTTFPMLPSASSTPVITTINQADLVIWDATNTSTRTPATQSDMATYLGVAEQQVPLNIDQSQFAGAPSATLISPYTTMKVRRGGIVFFKTTSGNIYSQFTKVYFNETADVQTVTTSTNSGLRTVPVGYVYLDEQTMLAGITSVTGASGIYIPVWLTPNYPVATI